MITLGVLKSIMFELEQMGISDDTPIVMAHSQYTDTASPLEIGMWAKVLYDESTSLVFLMGGAINLHESVTRKAVQAVAFWPEGD